MMKYKLIKTSLFVVLCFFAVMLPLPASAQIDPGCSAQTPICYGSTVVGIYGCVQPPIGSTECGATIYYNNYTVGCDSNCSFNYACTSNDIPINCQWNGIKCVANNCTTAGNCCGSGGNPPPPPGGNPPPPPPGGSTPTPTPGPVGKVQGRTAVVSFGLVNAQAVAGLVGSGKTVTVGTAGSDVVDPTGDGTGRTVYNVGNINLNGQNHTTTITSDPIPGYETGYSLCYNSTTCHDNATVTNDFLYTVGNSVSVSETSINNGGSNYADLWWHYNPLPTCSISGPSEIPINQTGTFTVNSAVPKPSTYVQVENHAYVNTSTSQTWGGLTLVSSSNCNDSANCSDSYILDPDSYGLNVGDTIYMSCRGSNGSPGGVRHWCNPFHEISPFGHPADANCGAADWIAVNITPNPTPQCAVPTLNIAKQCNENGTSNNTWSWNPVNGATSYRLQVSTSPTFNSFVVNTVTPFTQFTQLNVSSSTVYYGRVRVEGSDSNICLVTGAYSAVKQTDGVPCCTIALAPSTTQNTYVGSDPIQLQALMNSTSGIATIDYVQNALGSNPLSLSPTTSFIPFPPYYTNATPVSAGAATVVAQAKTAGGVVACTSNAVPFVVSNPTCTLDISPTSAQVGLGELQGFSSNFQTTPVGIDPDGGIKYTSGNVNYLCTSPGCNASTSSNTPPSYAAVFTTNTGAVPGQTTTVTASASVGGGASVCSDVASVEITDTEAWWQASGGDAMAGNSGTAGLESAVPSFFNPALQFMTGISGGTPGVPLFGGTSSTVSQDNVSDTGWLAEGNSGNGSGLAGYAGDTYNYDFFNSLVPSGVEPSIIQNNFVTGNFLRNTIATATPDAAGYRWIRATNAAGLTVSSNLSVTTYKVIILVDGSGITFNGNVSLDDGNGFLLVVSKGGINVGSTASTQNLEGLFVSDGVFDSCSSAACDQQLNVRGTVVAWGGLSLDRDLSTSNQNYSTPAEVFTFAPDLLLNYPSTLALPNIRWTEIAP